MILTSLSQCARPALHKVHHVRMVLRPSARTVVTWAEQDNWEDPRGPLGVDRPSPKLAPLTPESPKWLHDLHNNGVSDHSRIMNATSQCADRLASGLW